MTSTPKPLAKKNFWAKTIIDLMMLRAKLDPDYVADDLKVKQIEQWHLDTIAIKIWDLGYALAGKRFEMNRDGFLHANGLTDWFSAVNTFTNDAKVGTVVIINDCARMSRHRPTGVGQLVAIDRLIERPGQPLLYDQYGGPNCFSARYHLKTLNGEVTTWTNCDMRPISTHKHFEWDREHQRSRHERSSQYV